jgi:hypothetical protein
MIFEQLADNLHVRKARGAVYAASFEVSLRSLEKLDRPGEELDKGSSPARPTMPAAMAPRLFYRVFTESRITLISALIARRDSNA